MKTTLSFYHGVKMKKGSYVGVWVELSIFDGRRPARDGSTYLDESGAEKTE